jgi:hypothetical protein
VDTRPPPGSRPAGSDAGYARPVRLHGGMMVMRMRMRIAVNDAHQLDWCRIQKLFITYDLVVHTNKKLGPYPEVP